MKTTTTKMARRLLGSWLAAKREEARLSRSQLAEMIGKPADFVDRYESGNMLGVLEFAHITDVLGVDPNEAIELITSCSDVTRKRD